MATQRRTPSRQNPSKRSEAKNLAGSAFSSLADLLVHSRLGIVAIVFVALALFGALFDGIANNGRAYSGVSVQGIDVSGLDAEGIKQRVSNELESRLSLAGVTVYSNQQALNDRIMVQDYGDEVSVEEERKNRVSWTTDAESLQARIDYDKLIERVIGFGRGNIGERMSLLFGTQDVDVPLNYNEALVDKFASEIDLTIGKPLVNFDVAVDGGTAFVTEGSDGTMIDREVFKDQLSEEFLSDSAEGRTFVAEAVYTPVQIDRQSAQSVADLVNNAIGQGILFTCGDESWDADPLTLGTWIVTNVSKDENGTYSLVPSLQQTVARSSILSNIQPVFEDGEGHVSFVKAGDAISVTVTSKGTFPLVKGALGSLDQVMFGGVMESGDVSRDATGKIRVALEAEQIPESMSFDDALSYGVITPVVEFTTEYTTGASARNVNIHLASDLITDTVVKADGGIWSFNETAGECNEEKGFQAATAIAASSTIDEIGGGICQVATTVFNAVYLAGYPIIERYNHSLYVPSYPQGRDAAISWPNPDFRWQNDTSSDILLRMSYTDSTVTATLYGVDPGYTVESEEGEWLEGADYTTVYEVDDTLPVGTEYVKTTGQNGHSISVTRTVKDKEGTTIRQETFTSVYNPQNTIVVKGGAGA